MSETTILITEFMNQAGIDRLKGKFKIIYQPDLADKPDEIGDKLADVAALIIRNRTNVTEELLAHGPKLCCIGRLGVGLDNIDLAACREKNIAVYKAAGANASSVAEYVITSALMLLRGAFQANSAMLSGCWPRQQSAGHEISGKQIGLIGYGLIARKVADLAMALGMKPCAYDPFIPDDNPAWGNVQKCDLENLLASSDVVSLHIPLNDNSRNLLDAEKIAIMKDGAMLINTARGGIVDENSLASALAKGKLGGAAFDVFATEPLNTQDAQIFKNLDNVILTPHIAGVTQESDWRVGQIIADQIEAHLLDKIALEDD